MRVLQIYSGNLYGGVETLLVTIARQQYLCPNFENEFALCFEGRLAQELREAGSAVHLLGNVRVSRPHTILHARRALKKLLQERNFDVVVFHLQWVHGIFGSVARSMKIPVVNWMQAPTDGKHWTERWAKLVGTDLVLCASENTAKAAPIQFPNTPYEVFRTPIPFNHFDRENFSRREVRTELKTPDETVVIIQACRMEALKGHLMHLEALGKLRDIPNWICWQAGGSQRPQEVPYFEKVKKMAQRLEIADRVHFLGQRSDVPRLLSAADIYCQPNNVTEGFSLVFMEACAAGLPIVTTDLGSAGELVSETTGILVPPADVDYLTAALKRLICNEALRKELGEGARKRVNEMCDPETQIRKLHGIFSRLHRYL